MCKPKLTMKKTRFLTLTINWDFLAIISSLSFTFINYLQLSNVLYYNHYFFSSNMKIHLIICAMYILNKPTPSLKILLIKYVFDDSKLSLIMHLKFCSVLWLLEIISGGAFFPTSACGRGRVCNGLGDSKSAHLSQWETSLF